MGDDPVDPSRARDDDEVSSFSADGGSTPVADAVLPRFESQDVHTRTDGDLDSQVIPRLEWLPSERALLPSVAGPTDQFDAVLPSFDPAPEDAFPWETPDRSPAPIEDRPGDSFGIDGPEYDEEMPLADHIEEMVKRLAIVIVVAGSVSLIMWPFTQEVINFLWYSILPGTETAQPRIYEPLEFFLTRIKVASLVGLVVALPILVYEAYAFMRPGLYKNERKYYIAAIPTSLVLAVVGVLFAYFIVLPALFSYFLTYSQDAGSIAFALGRTFDLILILMAYLAIVFQIPLFIMLAIMMGLTTRQWLAEKRLYFWGAFLGLSFISSPDPTGMAPIIIALTMVALFEGTLGLLKWLGR